MNADELLQQWIEAERSVVVPAAAKYEGWQRLAGAVAAGSPAMAVPLSTIPMATGALLGEGAAVAIVVGTLGTVAIVATTPATHGPTADPSSAPTVAQPSQVVELPRTRASELPTPAVSEPVAKPSVPRTATVPSGAMVQAAEERATPSTTVASTSTLEEELKLLGRAKREIDRGQRHLAQVWLDEHRARFAHGVLAAERDGLTVLMLCEGGTSPGSRIKAEAFVRAYPTSPLLDRIRRACQFDAKDPE